MQNVTLLPGMSISKTDSSSVYTVVYVNVRSRLCILMQTLHHVLRAWNQETRLTATIQVGNVIYLLCLSYTVGICIPIKSMCCQKAVVLVHICIKLCIRYESHILNLCQFVSVRYRKMTSYNVQIVHTFNKADILHTCFEVNVILYQHSTSTKECTFLIESQVEHILAQVVRQMEETFQLLVKQLLLMGLHQRKCLHVYILQILKSIVQCYARINLT